MRRTQPKAAQFSRRKSEKETRLLLPFAFRREHQHHRPPHCARRPLNAAASACLTTRARSAPALVAVLQPLSRSRSHKRGKDVAARLLQRHLRGRCLPCSGGGGQALRGRRSPRPPRRRALRDQRQLLHGVRAHDSQVRAMPFVRAAFAAHRPSARAFSRTSSRVTTRRRCSGCWTRAPCPWERP